MIMKRPALVAVAVIGVLVVGSMIYLSFISPIINITSDGAADSNMEETGATEAALQTINTHETYFGYDRADAFANAAEARIETNADYELQGVRANEWSVGGAWRIEDERSVAFPGSTHLFNVQAPIYNIVLDAPEGTTSHIRVTVDGKPLDDAMLTDDAVRNVNGQAVIEVSEPRLYRITNIPDAGRHTVEIEVIDGEVRFYAATFG